MEEKKEPEKLSYEQLEQYAAEISQQNRQLYARMQEINAVNLFKRLDYLFKILEFSVHFDLDFVENCSKEIVTIMTPPEREEKEAEE